MLFIAVSSATAFASTPPINLGDALGSIEVVRCHFAEGRIVIRFGDGLHVLHEGDRLETANLNVVEINADSATLTLRSGDPTGSLRIVRVTNPSADAAALASTDTAKTAPIGTKHDVAPGSPSDG
jgi:urease accessory protein UreE